MSSSLTPGWRGDNMLTSHHTSYPPNIRTGRFGTPFLDHSLESLYGTVAQIASEVGHISVRIENLIECEAQCTKTEEKILARIEQLESRINALEDRDEASEQMGNPVEKTGPNSLPNLKVSQLRYSPVPPQTESLASLLHTQCSMRCAASIQGVVNQSEPRTLLW